MELHMENLKSALLGGNHSLVVRNDQCAGRGNLGPHVWAYDGRGIADLMTLLKTHPEQLKGASLADKVVGKAAAALMIEGGATEVYAHMISKAALALFSTHPEISVTYGTVVDHIINHDHTGWCPMEQLCHQIATASECVAAIELKLKQLKK